MSLMLFLVPVLAQAKSPPQTQSPATGASQPLTIGESFTLASKVLGETRRINVYLPAGYAEQPATRLPVLYMPDGGLGEDFLHVAGLLQVSIGNGTMRPFILVGIENTQRRRDLTPPTDNAEDRKVAPVVGGAANFRAFLRDELMPEIARRYRTTDETAIVGESFAGLFILDTLVQAPELFDTYLAFDPSLWWNDNASMRGFRAFLKAHPDLKARLFIAHSGEPTIASLAVWLPAILREDAPKGLQWRYLSLPDETHATIYHPAALQAFRAMLGPAPQ
jgi:hypothetical protein